MIPSVYFELGVKAVQLYGAELFGAFLLAGMINLLYAKRTVKESFGFLSAGFYMLVLRDLALIGIMVWPVVWPHIPLPPCIAEWTTVGLTSLIAALFAAGSLKNMRFYFSTFFLVPLLTVLLIAVGVGLPFLTGEMTFALHLPAIYLAASLIFVGISFHLAPNTRESMTVHSMGAGFLVLGICYIYLLIQLLPHADMILLICYISTLLLSLAAQVQFLNNYTLRLEEELQHEQKEREEIWEVSPFPIVVSRVRDDEVLYMNPAALNSFCLKKGEATIYCLKDFFVQPEKRIEMTDLIRQKRVIHNFEAEMQHPRIKEKIWMDISARTIDLDQEVAIYTTFKDITDQKKVTTILQEQASTDPLTGLYNRRWFETITNQLIHVAKRYGTPYCLVMIDIDFFKKFNDTYGHDIGDQVLTTLADTMRKTLRQSDVVARYGGEEFVIFFPQTTPEQGKVAAEKVRRAVEQMEIVLDGERVPVTISLGISGSDSEMISELVKEADLALYHSKRHGRNQSTCYAEIDDIMAQNESTDTDTESNAEATVTAETPVELPKSDAADTPQENDK